MPLVNILAPQIMKKAAEFEAKIGPPPGIGYLDNVGNVSAGAASAGGMKMPQRKKGETASAAALRSLREQEAANAVAKPIDPIDTRVLNPAQSAFASIAAAQSMGPVGQAFGRGYIKGSGLGFTEDGKSVAFHKRRAPTLIPNAPSKPAPQAAPMTLQHGGKTITVNPGDVTDELGNPVRMEPAQKFDARGRQIIDLGLTAPTTSGHSRADRPKYLGQGQPIGTNERGETVDKKGKKVKGYLNQDPNLRFDMYRPENADVGHLLKFGGAGGVREIERRYRQHLDATQYDRGSGEMMFPEGYFSGMSEAEKLDIERGVEALRRIGKGAST